MNSTQTDVVLCKKNTNFVFTLYTVKETIMKNIPL